MTDDTTDSAAPEPNAPPDTSVPDDLDRRLAWLPLNDTGNGERLVARFGDDILYVLEQGWYAWNGRFWDMTAGDLVVETKARQTVKAMRREYAALLERGAFDDEAPADFEKRLGKFLGWAARSGDMNRIRAMVHSAKDDCKAAPADMDADPTLLTLENGTLVLDGACETLLPHHRESRITKMMPATFDKDADAPAFRKFLHQILPDESVRLFLQRWFGYCLTGNTGEQVLVFLHGKGSNGKSTLLHAIGKIMGPYSIALPFSSLQHDERRRGGDATPDLARLPGARMVCASEPEKGTRFSESTLKSITGGEAITVRHLRQGFFEFEPEFKLILSGNYKPRITGQDHGIWRRVLLVPFTVSIPREHWDLRLDQKLWAERAGILNWMLDGLRMFLDDGLGVPDTVRQATDAYQSESDPVGRFIQDCVAPAEGVSVQAGDMYQAYCDWCRANGESPWKKNGFGRAMTERGVGSDRVAGWRYYTDVALSGVPDPDHGRGDSKDDGAGGDDS